MPPADGAVAADRLDTCLPDIVAWLKASRLRLDPSKTQVMWLGSVEQVANVQLDEIPELSSQVTVVGAANNLGVLFDIQLSMSAQEHRLLPSVATSTVSYDICDR